MDCFVFLVALLALSIVAAVFLWRSLQPSDGFSSPRDVLDAYYDALGKGDTERCLRCLDPVVQEDLIEIWGSREELLRRLSRSGVRS